MSHKPWSHGLNNSRQKFSCFTWSSSEIWFLHLYDINNINIIYFCWKEAKLYIDSWVWRGGQSGSHLSNCNCRVLSFRTFSKLVRQFTDLIISSINSFHILQPNNLRVKGYGFRSLMMLTQSVMKCLRG